MPTSSPYHERFILSVRRLQADKNLASVKDAAAFLGLNYMSLYKIMDGTNKPTIEHCVLLCKKNRINANWLLTGRGEMFQSDQIQLGKLLQEIKQLRSDLGLIKP